MTLLWLLTGSVLANIAIWSGQKLAPSAGMVMITIGLALGWVVPRGEEYFALRNGTDYHADTCQVVRDAKANKDALTTFANAKVAESRGLEAHRCVHDRNRSTAYKTTTPQRNPPRNVKTNSISSPPMTLSANRAGRVKWK